MVSLPETGIAPHRLQRMLGRDPHQRRRAATPLELLFDLAFVVSFAQSSEQGAELLAHGHIGAGVWGFAFCAMAICWAWVNFAWFASGFATDDWLFRLTTMVQVAGVIVVALGVAPVFESLSRGEPLDNTVLVAGYVVMRVGMLAQWVRVIVQDPAHRRVAIIYAATIAVAQVGWVLTAVIRIESTPVFVAVALLLYAIELGGPVVAKRDPQGEPWNASHITERYALLFIITLGEGIAGTVAAVAAAVNSTGWTAQAVLLVIAGTGMILAIWWSYYIVPFERFLIARRSRAPVFGYGHILVFASIAAIGMGLRVCAYVLEGDADLGVLGAVLSIVVPMVALTIAYYGTYSVLLRAVDPLHLVLAAGTLAVLVASVVCAASGVSLGVCLLVVMAAPFVTVVGYETIGYRHVAADAERG